MSAFQCPECNARFPRPAERDDEKPQCPWCGEVGQLEMADEVVVRTRVRSTDDDSNEDRPSGIWGDGLLEKLR